MKSITKFILLANLKSLQKIFFFKYLMIPNHYSWLTDQIQI